LISVVEAQQKFSELLASDPSWQTLASSQFAEHVAVFCAWALRDAQFKTERDRQEFFLSTALNRSSILAHAEDREYLPTKGVPSSGTILFTNLGESTVAVPKGTEFLTPKSIPVTTTAAVVVSAGQTVSISAEQKTQTVHTFSVTEEKQFLECLLPIDTTNKLASYTVDVSDSYGVSERWTYYRLLLNTFATTRAFDEFYSHNGQTGIRFGNGNFGKIPSSGSTVTITAWETEGNIFLASGQQLYPVKGLGVLFKAVIGSAFTSGRDMEGTESIRRNLHYWQTFNEEMVWRDDYTYFLRRKFPELVHVRAWGEQEAEQQAGGMSLDFLNKIFVVAYAVGGADMQTSCMTALETVRPLNRRFQWVPVRHVYWTIQLTGRVLDDVSLVDAQAAIKAALYAEYGRDSATRRDKVYVSEIYEVILATGFFRQESGARFSLTTGGSIEPELLEDMVSIDIDNSTFTLTYAGA